MPSGEASLGSYGTNQNTNERLAEVSRAADCCHLAEFITPHPVTLVLRLLSHASES